MSMRTTLEMLLKRFEKTFAVYNKIEVSRSAVLRNFDAFEKLSGKNVIPVLKANAYGHGIAQIATALKDRDLPYIAVDGYFEALRVREVSKQPVLIMGAIMPENFRRMKYDNFAFVVQDAAAINALGSTRKRIKVHLECNTGMNRHGAKLAELSALTRRILQYDNLELEGVMSHLADSDGNDPATVDVAVEKFDACVDVVLAAGAKPTIFHVAQSAGSLKAKSRYANCVRVGIGLYGVNPFPRGHVLHEKLQAELRPAMRLVSTVSKIIELDKGDEVSYNYTFAAPKKMRIGVLPLGYYEGVNRALSNAGLVKVGKTFAPIAGRVCMNHTMINLDDLPVKVGDQVVVYSDKPADANSIDQIADKFGLFNYNLLSALSADVRRVVVD